MNFRAALPSVIPFSRPVLSLWPDCWRFLFLLFVVFAPGAVFCSQIPSGPPGSPPDGVLRGLLIFALPAPAALVACVRQAWLLRLVRRVRRFRTVLSPRVVLHHDPEIGAGLDLGALIEHLESALDDLTRHFGSGLRRPLTVFLFSSWKEINDIFGRHYAGTALPSAGAIVISADRGLWEVTRHELAHLFSIPLNPNAPPLFSEGLPTWLQGTVDGWPVDAAARLSLCEGNIRLASLLKRKFFFSDAHIHTCYVLAGSFSGFLIRRYGWKAYRKFFRVAHALDFRRTFRKTFGVPFERAEWQWRTELVVMEVLRCRLEDELCS